MLYRVFTRVVFAAAIVLAALFVMPAAQVNADSAATFTSTPLAQPETIDVQLDPIINPGRVIDLTPAPQPVVVAGPSESAIPTSPIKALEVGFAMMIAGLALICIPIVAESGRSGGRAIPA